LPALQVKVDFITEKVRGLIGSGMQQLSVMPSPILISKFTTEIGDLAFFSMFTTFGRPMDITLASLRVEHMFAADSVTRDAMEKLLG
jgi:hypothetical protein